jgi:hypothetical protein
MSKTFLIVDPFHEYAVRFLDVVARHFGYQPICIFTEPGEIRAGLRNYPCLRGLESAYLPREQLEDFGRQLRGRRDVAGAIPFNEATLGPVLALLRGLDSGWNEPAVLALLRDKFALKEHVRKVRPELNVGVSKRFSLEAGPFSLEGVPERFVLKPNDGYGNRSVGFFTHRTPLRTIEGFLRKSSATDFVLEEYFPGNEYFVNGQVDAQGACIIVGAFRYERTWANGSQVDWLTHKVSWREPEFATLESYARAILAAVGLRRSPFHLEVKLTDGSPHLVELGSRLAGNGNATLCNRLHGGALDVFLLAADHYLHDKPRTGPRLDWTTYDAKDVLYVHGVSFDSARVYQVSGVEEVKRHPLFMDWVKKLEIGVRLSPTVDLFSSPWSFLLAQPAASRETLIAASDRLRALLRANASPAPLLRSVLAIRDLAGRAKRRIERFRSRHGHDKVPSMASGRNLVLRATRAAVRRLHRMIVAVWPRGRPHVLTASRSAKVSEVFAWVQQFLAEPHPLLGRPGPICPFVQGAMKLDRLEVAFESDVDGADIAPIRAALLRHAQDFAVHSQGSAPADGFNSRIIVFPNVPQSRGPLLDQVHTELKTDLMREDVMVSAFHPLSARPALGNPQFRVFQAPFVAFALRRMDVRDIAFVGHNRRAFARYKDRFGPVHEQGLVSDEFGYATAYREAVKRFAD